MDKAAILGIDLGGTKISGALFNGLGEIIHREKILIGGLSGVEIGHQIIHLIERFLKIAGKFSLKVTAIGTAVPGIYHRDDQTVWAPNIAGWERFPLYRQLRDHLGDSIHLEIDNDRACYILGETWKGAAKNCKHAIYLAVGTGIGAGILVNGKVLRGQSDIAGAIGWLSLTEQFISPYSEHGCFEHHASGSGIARIATEAYDPSDGKQTDDKISTERVFEYYAQGDSVATHIIQSAISYWGRATANLVSLFNPEVVIFGGGVFGPATSLLDDIYQEASKWAQPVSMKQVRILYSKLGSEAGLYGAAYLVKDYLKVDP